MGVLFQGIVVRPCESEIRQFDVQFFLVNQNILGFEISMDDSIGMTVVKGQEKLIDD